MRTIEVLGMRKKLITTNEDIVNYDFYDKLILIAGIMFVLSWFVRRICLQEFI